jgi:hypothetical protein
MNRAARGKALYECSLAELRLPAGVVSMQATESGFAFTFADRVMPGWFMQLAHRLGMIPKDKDTHGRLNHGRKVELQAQPDEHQNLRRTFDRALDMQQRTPLRKRF